MNFLSHMGVQSSDKNHDPPPKGPLPITLASYPSIYFSFHPLLFINQFYTFDVNS
jgi:hypothetical protein